MPLLGSPDNRTPSAIGKGVILTGDFQFKKIFFGNQKHPVS